jgi:hypothetical protein
LSELLRLSTLANDLGLTLRGAFHSHPADGVPTLANCQRAGTLVLLGWVGGAQWPAFANSPEARDGNPDALDRWSRRMVEQLADETDATALFHFGGPPYLPFQRWAQRAEPVFPSPLGLLVHADHGLWHSYRGALAFAYPLELPVQEVRGHPCETCIAKPCLTTCPVGAFSPGHYDVDTCAAHVKSDAGSVCRFGGCLARRACPVGQGLAYGREQASFYMEAFVAER